MQRVHFSPNVPQQIALKETTPTQDGPDWRFELEDGRALVVPRKAAVAILELDPAAGESFMVCKRWDGEPNHPPYWDLWLSPRAEQERAASESVPMMRDPETDLEALLQASVRRERTKRTAAPARSGDTASLKPTGTEGPQPVPLPRPAVMPAPPQRKAGKIPYNIALGEILQFVTSGLKSAGEQWHDQAKQDLVSTLLIQAAKDGYLTLWERQQ